MACSKLNPTTSCNSVNYNFEELRKELLKYRSELHDQLEVLGYSAERYMGAMMQSLYKNVILIKFQLFCLPVPRCKYTTGKWLTVVQCEVVDLEALSSKFES